MTKKIKLLLAIAIILHTLPSHAYDQQHILMGVEYFDWNDADGSNDDSLGFNIEYRSKALKPEYIFDIENFSWLAGLDVTGDKDFYAYTGLLYDWNFYDKFSLVPNVAAGLYHHENGQDLGGSFNFRTSLELNYKITEDSRIGLAVNHHSNADLHSRNPGMENFVVSYSFAF